VAWDFLDRAVRVVQVVNPAFCQGPYVIHLVGEWIKPMRFVQDFFTAPVAGWFASGDDAAVPVSAGGVTHRA
jgi:hypothetical protein